MGRAKGAHARALDTRARSFVHIRISPRAWPPKTQSSGAHEANETHDEDDFKDDKSSLKINSMTLELEKINANQRLQPDFSRKF